MDRKNRAVLWLAIFIILIMLLCTLATYAYINVNVKKSGSFNVEVNTKGVDILTIDGGNDVVLTADVSNFAKDNGSDIVGESDIKLELSTTKETSKYCYEVSVDLPNKKVFDYSLSGTPELLLTVSSSEDGFAYEEIYSKIDVTTRTGKVLVPIKKDSSEYIHEISTVKDGLVSKYYKAKLTFVWLPDVNQSTNDQKSYKASLKANVVEC